MRRGSSRAYPRFYEVKLDFTAISGPATSNTQLFFCPLCIRRTKPSPFKYSDLFRHIRRYHGMQSHDDLFSNPQIPKRTDPHTGQLLAVRCVYDECCEWFEMTNPATDACKYRAHVLDHSAEFLDTLGEVGYSPSRGIQEWYRNFLCPNPQCQKVYYTDANALYCCRHLTKYSPPPLLPLEAHEDPLNHLLVLDSCEPPILPTIDNVRWLREEQQEEEEDSIHVPKKRRREEGLGGGSTSSPSSPQVPKQIQRPAPWPEEPDAPADTKDENLCVICLVRANATTSVPCGHVCCCVTCAVVSTGQLVGNMAPTCPVCRAPLTAIIRLFH